MSGGGFGNIGTVDLFARVLRSAALAPTIMFRLAAPWQAVACARRCPTSRGSLDAYNGSNGGGTNGSDRNLRLDRSPMACTQATCASPATILIPAPATEPTW